jgi:hypothetical protein
MRLAVAPISVVGNPMTVAAMIYREEMFMRACVAGTELALQSTIRSDGGITS